MSLQEAELDEGVVAVVLWLVDEVESEVEEAADGIEVLVSLGEVANVTRPLLHLSLPPTAGGGREGGDGCEEVVEELLVEGGAGGGIEEQHVLRRI